MEGLHVFLNEWKKAKSPQSFLEKGLTLPPQKKVQDFLKKLPKDEKEAIERKLQEIDEALSAFEISLTKELSGIVEEMQSNEKRTKAHLSYTKAKGTGQTD